jgi:hypothetical protein
MPKLEYPYKFDGGLIGMRCKDDINHREAFCFVPYKMIMCVGKAQTHPIISRIIEENKLVFDETENADWEQLTLTLFLFYELSLG